jgi:crossover junction endodeoxyribonuclease RuvC
MIVLGIDPGLATVGYGVIQVEGRRTIALAYGCITTPGSGMTGPARLEMIYRDVIALIVKYSPACLATERLFFTKNITSAMQVAEVRGVIALAAQQNGVPVVEYTPNQVKQAITGSGRADKRQVQDMISRLLSLAEIPKPDDAADGLSIALCHINSVR